MYIPSLNKDDDDDDDDDNNDDNDDDDDDDDDGNNDDDCYVSIQLLSQMPVVDLGKLPTPPYERKFTGLESSLQ